MKMGVQQIMLGSVTGSQEQARRTLRRIREAGYDGIELNGFMIRPTPVLVRLLTRAAGMPAGGGGRLDWKKLVGESGLEVMALHEDLGFVEGHPEEVVEEAGAFGTDKIVITGMYRFDYGNREEVKRLCQRLNQAGERLARAGIALLYHNHNVEFCRYPSENIYGLMVEETDERYVNFELDSYWIADAGVDPLAPMRSLGRRLRLYHINDRGSRRQGPSMTPIVKQDSCELGYGNMNLAALIEAAKEARVDGIILESHRNWIDKDPIKSLQVSGEFLRKHTW